LRESDEILKQDRKHLFVKGDFNSMKINLNIPGINADREPHLTGLFLSCLSNLKDVLDKKKKASSIIHFVEERLNKLEKREFSKFLQKVIEALDSDKKDEIRETDSPSPRIPKDLNRIFDLFSNRVSRPARVSHQIPYKAGMTRTGEILERLSKIGDIDANSR